MCLPQGKGVAPVPREFKRIVLPLQGADKSGRHASRIRSTRIVTTYQQEARHDRKVNDIPAAADRPLRKRGIDLRHFDGPSPLTLPACDPTSCANCGARMQSVYCPDCGQRTARGQLSLRGMGRDFVGMVMQVETHLLPTVWELLRAPQATLHSYSAEPRRHYTHSFALLVFTATRDLSALVHGGTGGFAHAALVAGAYFIGLQWLPGLRRISKRSGCRYGSANQPTGIRNFRRDFPWKRTRTPVARRHPKQPCAASRKKTTHARKDRAGFFPSHPCRRKNAAYSAFHGAFAHRDWAWRNRP